MRSVIAKFLRDRAAATAIEYGLIAGLIALVAIAGLTTAFNAIGGQFGHIGNVLSGQ